MTIHLGGLITFLQTFVWYILRTGVRFKFKHSILNAFIDFDVC